MVELTFVFFKQGVATAPPKIKQSIGYIRFI